jgi:hypothetical protein
MVAGIADFLKRIAFDALQASGSAVVLAPSDAVVGRPVTWVSQG